MSWAPRHLALLALLALLAALASAGCDDARTTKPGPISVPPQPSVATQPASRGAPCGPRKSACVAPNECALDRCHAKVEVAAGAHYSCAKLASGRVACWGSGNRMDRGDAASASRMKPVVIQGVADVVQVAVGGPLACALRRTGDVLCWAGPGHAPSAVPGVSEAIAVSSGGDHACAIRRDGRVLCWGRGVHGQLGDGLLVTRKHASAVPGIHDAVEVSCGAEHTCIAHASGHVDCFGANGDGRLGDGTTTARPSPVRVSKVDDAVAVTTGARHSCALRADGTFSCWGDARSAPELERRSLEQIGGVDQLGAAAEAVCARGARGISCWGFGRYPLVGPRDEHASLLVTGTAGATQASVGAKHVCFTRGAGEVACFGSNDGGALGLDPLKNFSRPTALAGFTDVSSVLVGLSESCATLRSGDVFCWTYTNRPTDEVAFGEIDTVGSTLGVRNRLNAVASTLGNRKCALRRNGTVVCWTASGSREIAGITDAVEISGSDYTTCVRRRSGSVACWDGDGAVAAIPGVEDGVQLSAGSHRNCVLRKSGKIVCWRDPAFKVTKGPPLAIAGISGAVEVSMGTNHGCARLKTGKVTCWEYDGPPETSAQKAPRPVDDLEDAAKISAGQNYACAIRRSGKVACWGQLPDELQTTGVRDVAGLEDVAAIVAGGQLTCAIGKSGTLTCWGSNSHGQIGVDPIFWKFEPIHIPLPE